MPDHPFALHDAARYKLHFGPYRTPKFRRGARVLCQVRGKVQIVGVSDGRIPWPVGKLGPHKALVVYGRLAKAIRKESVQAVAHWFGVHAQTVTKWRRLLGIAGQPLAGTHRLRRQYGKEPFYKRAQKKAWAKASDPDRCEKIAAAHRGKPRPPGLMEALHQAKRGRPLSAETRRKMSEAHRRRGTRPPKAGKPWTAEEDALLRRLPNMEVVRRTGRTLVAVKSRRRVLGIRVPR